MTQEAFQQLYSLLRQHWTKKNGVLMRLQVHEEDPHPLILTVGRIKNTGLRAEFCKVWDGDKLLWDGPIYTPELLSILHTRGICYCELNTAAKLDVRQGPCYCLGQQVDPYCDLFCSLRTKSCSTKACTTRSRGSSDKSESQTKERTQE